MKRLYIILWIEIVLSIIVLMCSSCAPTRYRAEYYDGDKLIKKIDVSYCPILVNTQKTGLDVTLGDGARLQLGESNVNSDEANKTVRTGVPAVLNWFVSLFMI